MCDCRLRKVDRLRQLRGQLGGTGEDGDFADARAVRFGNFEDERCTLGGESTAV
jgi:hypothetical protein